MPPAPAAIHDAVVEILKDGSRRPIEPTLENDLIADLGFDSLQVMETIAALEDRFDVEFPERMLTRSVFQTIDAIAAALTELQTESAASRSAP